MPNLAPIEDSEIQPRLARSLQPGEVVLWQGAPLPGTFVSPSSTIWALIAAGGGLALLAGLLDDLLGMSLDGQPRLVAGLALVAIGAVAFVAPRLSERTPRVYAITDRRLVVVKGDTVYRSVHPADIYGFRTRRNIVYWRPLVPQETGRNSSPEKRYPGFHGLEDPEEMLATLESWREGFSRRAEESAAAFLADDTRSAPAAGDAPVRMGDASTGGARSVRHPGTGLTVDIPAGWQATIRQDHDGPLQIFGITLLKRVIRPGQQRPLESGGDWNLMIARGGPDAGIAMQIVQTPIPQTYDQVMNDPWARTFNLKLLKSDPDVAIGPFRGFSVARQMPEGANLQMFDKIAAPVAVRQIWLGRDGMHVHFMGMARLDQHDVQRAVDAAVMTLRVT